MSVHQSGVDHPWVYQGAARGFIPGVPARDLTEDEHAAAVKAGRIVAGDPTGRLYKKAAAKAAEKGAKA